MLILDTHFVLYVIFRNKETFFITFFNIKTLKIFVNNSFLRKLLNRIYWLHCSLNQTYHSKI